MEFFSQIISVGSILLLIVGGILTGIAGVQYKIRVGSLFANPTNYDKAETRLASVGIVLLIVGAAGFVLHDIYIKPLI